MFVGHYSATFLDKTDNKIPPLASLLGAAICGSPLGGFIPSLG
jgi:hypothetical protein